MSNIQELNDNVKISIVENSCYKPFVCTYSERILSYAVGVDITEEVETPEEVFKECCYTHIVLADINSDSDIRNDYSSFYHQNQLSNETADFFLFDFSTSTEYELIDSTYGQFFDFGYFKTNLDLKGYMIEWRKVLTELGRGSYKIIKRQVIANVSVTVESIVFNLEHYGDSLANYTTRIDIVQNGYFKRDNIDFTGTNWKHSLRIRGFFGNREFQLEEDILVNRNFERKQISISQTNEYKFQTNLIPYCITNEIVDFFLFANDIYITDYNLNNHSYFYKKFPVKYGSNENTEYNHLSRRSRLNLIFTDKNLNRRKNNYY